MLRPSVPGKPTPEGLHRDGVDHHGGQSHYGNVPHGRYYSQQRHLRLEPLCGGANKGSS